MYPLFTFLNTPLMKLELKAPLSAQSATFFASSWPTSGYKPPPSAVGAPENKLSMCVAPRNNWALESRMTFSLPKNTVVQPWFKHS